MKMKHFTIIRGVEVNKVWKVNWYNRNEEMLLRCRKDGTYTLTDKSNVYFPSEIFQKMNEGDITVWKDGKKLVSQVNMGTYTVEPEF